MTASEPRNLRTTRGETSCARRHRLCGAQQRGRGLLRSNEVMSTDPRLQAVDVRAFLSRDWEALRDRKDQHWIEVERSRGGAATLDVAEALSRHVSRFATTDMDERRMRDLLDLIELKRRIDAASARLRR
jgi:hypothetical protein